MSDMVAEIILLILFTGYILNIIVRYVVKRIDLKRKEQETKAFEELKQDIDGQNNKKSE